jgi:hypothetical protein
MADAEARSNYLLVWGVQSFVLTYLALLADDPERARRELKGAFETWQHGMFQLQRIGGEVHLTQIDLYEGASQTAATRLRRVEVLSKRSNLWSVHVYRVWQRYLQGCAALGMGRPRRALRRARALEREGFATARALALALRAGAAPARQANARALWHAAARALAACHMDLHAACARLRADDPTGAQRLRELDVKNPLALARLLTPLAEPTPRTSRGAFVAPQLESAGKVSKSGSNCG